MRTSELITLVANFEFELESFEGHQAAAEFIPGNLPAINDKERQTSVLPVVPRDAASDDPGLSDLQTVFAVLKMFYGKAALHFFDQSAEHGERVFLGACNHLEPVARRDALAEFERVQSDARAEQESREVEFVEFPVGIFQTDRIKFHMLEVGETGGRGGLAIEAAVAKPFVSDFHRAVFDNREARDQTAAAFAFYSPHGASTSGRDECGIVP